MSRKIRVLVVDDNEVFRDLVVDQLSEFEIEALLHILKSLLRRLIIIASLFNLEVGLRARFNIQQRIAL